MRSLNNLVTGALIALVGFICTIFLGIKYDAILPLIVGILTIFTGLFTILKAIILSK